MTEDGFIFYAFGYDHPADKTIVYLKYIPKKFKSHFELVWIPNEWDLGEIKYIRPKQLYSPEIFKKIEQVFKKNYPQYLYRDHFIGKTVFVVPHHLIQRVYTPRVQWQALLKKSNPSQLEQEAIELIQLLAQHAKVSSPEFGLHGSLSTGMATPRSDIDIAVYGANNFFRVKKAVFELFKDKKLNYLNELETDAYRMNKGEYKGRKFVFNGIRGEKGLINSYGKFKFTQIRHLHFYCDIVKSMERMFRPAIYQIEDYLPFDDKSLLIRTHWPSQVVSMIGEFRDVAKKGDEVEVHGMLEKVKRVDKKDVYYRVVIGSGKGKEFIWPV